MKLEVRYSNHFDDVKHYTTQQLRDHFLVEKVFTPGEMKLVYSTMIELSLVVSAQLLKH